VNGRPFPAEEPDAGMRAMAKVFRQMFVALVQEGFTPTEALAMVGTALATMIVNAGKPDT
jgi:hypothetical protein